MTRIRATCPVCGEVDLLPTQIELHVVRPSNDPEGVADGSLYAFDCPLCERHVTKPADDRIVQLLATGGVAVAFERAAPAATRHPESPPGGAPLTHDDLLDFHLLLARNDWFEVLAGSLR